MGRRTALANWLASADNPLTARVMVNRIWQFRMGTGIVRTPNDFGVMGDRPSNQALLDWLASEFVAQGLERKEHRPHDCDVERVSPERAARQRPRNQSIPTIVCTGA